MLTLNRRVPRLPLGESLVVQSHKWVAVPDPYKKRALLHACDNCGVVKSENTSMKNCAARLDQLIISDALLVINH